MEENNVLNNEEVMEVTEKITNRDSKKGIKIAAGIGLTVLTGIIVYKYVLKPVAAKIKAKKEARVVETVNSTVIEEEVDDQT